MTNVDHCHSFCGTAKPKREQRISTLRGPLMLVNIGKEMRPLSAHINSMS